MKKGTLSLALHLAALIEGHSDDELQSAVNLLKKYGSGESLLDALSRRDGRSIEGSTHPRQTVKSKPNKSSSEIVSRAVLALKEKEPEKYRLLYEFDSLVRREQILPTNEDLRRFGERLSKSFVPKKVRRETISALMTTLASRTTGDIENLIAFAATFGVSGATDEYQRLAQFLIEGKVSSPAASATDALVRSQTKGEGDEKT